MNKIRSRIITPLGKTNGMQPSSATYTSGDIRDSITIRIINNLSEVLTESILGACQVSWKTDDHNKIPNPISHCLNIRVFGVHRGGLPSMPYNVRNLSSDIILARAHRC